MERLEQVATTKLYGRGITATTVMIIVVITAAIVAIIKMLSSSRGKVKIGDLTLQWGK